MRCHSLCITGYTALVFAAATVLAPVDALADKVDSSRSGGLSTGQILMIEGAYYGASLVVLRNTWYADRDVVPFHFFDDSGGYLQVDKFGHAFGSYVQSYIGYRTLARSGLSRRKALLMGGSLGLVLQTPIEIMDGVHEGWGFSWSDMAANAAGSGLVIGQELLFGEQVALMKFSYSESSYARRANGYLGTSTIGRLLDDYNGHTYWLSVPMNRLPGTRSLPAWLAISVGYGANGMYGEFENITSYRGVDIPPATRYRQFLLSLDVDWTRIRTRSRTLRVLLHTLTFVKLPFPALEYRSTGSFAGHWLAF